MTPHNKTIVVTGCCSGIGADFAKLARQQGARVIGVDRNAPTLTLDGFVQVDLGDPAAINDAVAQLPAKVDALANIAGVPGTSPAELVGRVNYLGLRHFTYRVLERMGEGGSIVNISSILGAEWPQRLEPHRALGATTSFEEGAKWLAAHPVPQETCYQYFKEALIVWTYTQSQKIFMERGVRMNCVAPGPVFTPILGDFVQMLQMDRSTEFGETQRGHVRLIEKAGQHLLAVLGDVLDLSRIEAGSLPLNITAQDSAHVVDDALHLVSDLARRHRITLHTEGMVPHLAVRADRVRLRQVLVNLLVNAIKYNRPGGQVALSSWRDGGRIMLEVRDSGIGMDPTQLAHLFEPFNRLGAERTGIEGTGIGLVIVQRLVTLMHK